MAAQLTRTFETANNNMMLNPVSTYKELLETPEWEARRKQILHRDSHRCRNCGNGSALQVHHRQYHADRNGNLVYPWNYADRYLVTLCEACHKRGHKLYRIPVFTLYK